MNATELNTAYAAHLERMLRPPRAEHVNERSIRHMLAQTRRAEPCRYVEERRTIRILADRLVDGRTPPGETTLDRLRPAGAA